MKNHNHKPENLLAVAVLVLIATVFWLAMASAFLIHRAMNPETQPQRTETR